MDPIVKYVLFLHLFHIGIHLSPRPTNAVNRAFWNENCELHHATIGYTFVKKSGNCKGFDMAYVNFKETSQQLFDSLADGLDALTVFECNLDLAYLPSNLTHFRITGHSGCTTQIAIAENSTYKLEYIHLKSLPQLPANLGVLRSLKMFDCQDILGANIDFMIFGEMKQLERIDIVRVAGVTGNASLQLLCLRDLKIVDSSITFVNSTFFEFPALERLYLQNNSLHAIPEHCSTFANLTRFIVTNNKLQRVVFDELIKMKHLVFLDLSYNEITEITTDNQVELPRLKLLYFNNNKLTQLNVTLWVMPALEIIHLRGNQLKQLAGLLTLITKNLRTITILMSGNPWDCAWTMEMVKEIHDLQISTADGNDFCNTTGWIFKPSG